jgi:hypothetical protein
MDNVVSSETTSAVSFVEAKDGRMRRRQRGISKKDLQRAKKYGGK